MKHFAFLLLLLATTARAEWRVSAEIEPVEFFLHGYGFALAAKPPASHLRFGLLFSQMNLPNVLAHLGGNDDWGVRLTQEAGATAAYFFDPSATGLYVGGHLLYTAFSYAYVAAPDRPATGRRLLVVPHVGYQWFPWGSGVFVLPWAGLALNVGLEKEPTVAGVSYKEPLVLPLGAVHFGFEL